MVSGTRLVFKVQIASLLQHQTSGISKAYAAACAFCGEERHKNTLACLGRYRLSVVADVENRFVVLQRYLRRSGLHGILDEVDEHLSQHVTVDADSDIVCHVTMPVDLGIELL